MNIEHAKRKKKIILFMLWAWETHKYVLEKSESKIHRSKVRGGNDVIIMFPLWLTHSMVLFLWPAKNGTKKEINYSSFKNWTLVFRDSSLLNVYAILISIGIFKHCNSSGHIALYFSILERMTMLKVQFSCFFFQITYTHANTRGG